MHQFITFSGMETAWRQRLIDAIERDGRSLRAISKAADLGPNFLFQMIDRGTMPSAQAVVSLCQVLGISLTYVFTGAEMTPQDEELLRLSAGLVGEQKELLVQLARQLQERERR
jgi:lambda repressor-like predicted transcriptional regulator